MDSIRIRGARTHNLKNLSLDIPRDRLVVITGLSGSGKSSLAFDTLYAEGQRRYVESLSAYARQFLQLMEKPDVDAIEGLSPAIAIEQKATSHNPRSTVGTVTEIHDYLRLLYARAGTPHCPSHPEHTLEAQTISQMVDELFDGMPEGSPVAVLAPLVEGRKGEHSELFEQFSAQGFVRVRINGAFHELDERPLLDKNRKHDIDLVVDRLRLRPDSRQRLAESLETALQHGHGRVRIHHTETAQERLFSSRMACPVCQFALAELEPRLFSFNNPAGACPRCDGLGAIDYFDPQRIVARPELSLSAGAVRGWDKKNPFYHALLVSLAEHYGVDLDTPFADLPERFRQVVLEGSGTEVIRFRYPSDGGRMVEKPHAFEGLVRHFERRYRETDSLSVREELARYRSTHVCPDCQGARLKPEARCVTVGGIALPDFSGWPLHQARVFVETLELPQKQAQIAQRILHEIHARLVFLMDVGLDYLSLNRSADTLSGGEAQRIRLASQIGSGLTGVMYVLDEPSIGLHQRDNDRLLKTLLTLRDMGNTVIVVEHDEEAIRMADHVIDMGPGAGEHGGTVVAEGRAEVLCASEASLTGAYLSGRLSIPVPEVRRLPKKSHTLSISGCTGHNLKSVDLDLPLGIFTCITGVSGSGKSTLINDTLARAVARALGLSVDEAAPFTRLKGVEALDKIINVDQSPIGRTPRSNPATYTGLLTPIRELFAGVPEARARGYSPGRFSFNVKGGRCEACQGDGLIKVAMHFLPDLYVPCDVCHGKRYNRETLEIRYRDRNIFDVLEMTVSEALAFFQAVPAVARRLQTLMDVGLGYIRLGQSATTLSGGEAQRVKLALELSRRDTGKTLYILDEPTTGLHFADIALLLGVLQRLVGHGNTVVVIEHNLDVIRTADWIIDLGPEGGAGGGHIIAQGPPETVATIAQSHTGRYLARH
jgi:excinuclease ABC subunit A